MTRKAPTVKPRRDLNRSGEAYFEVWAPGAKAGCLLCVREVPQGGVQVGTHVVIEAYAGDPKVFVRLGGHDHSVPR